ncbi:MAG: His/Gly/Thr/Pro-type tRNA ligase C-terminal domain-containing protein, partial [Burkholderiaceae bacterium]
NFGGAFPLWLSPVQIAVASISEGQANYAADVAKMLQDEGLRVEADLRNDKISYKIRELSLQKIPYVLVVGDQEKSSGSVSVRRRGGEDLGVMPLKDVLNLFKQDLEEGS